MRICRLGSLCESGVREVYTNSSANDTHKCVSANTRPSSGLLGANVAVCTSQLVHTVCCKIFSNNNFHAFCE